MGSQEHTPSTETDNVRWDRVREARRKVARGDYDGDPRALELTAERALEDLLRQSELRAALREQEEWAMGWSPEGGVA